MMTHWLVGTPSLSAIGSLAERRFVKRGVFMPLSNSLSCSSLAECRKRRLNQGSFVLLFFRLYTLSDLYLVFACLFSCTVFVLSFCMFIFLYCFFCQYQSSDWL